MAEHLDFQLREDGGSNPSWRLVLNRTNNDRVAKW